MKKVIITDASVAAKWLLPDEYDLIADSIKEEFINQRIEIAVPVLIFYEINNVLKSAVLSNRISTQDALNFTENFLNLNFNIHSSNILLKNALQIAIKLGISSYDASYVVLAEYLQAPFYTSDEKLVKKVKNSLVKNLSEY